jgi:hypothetical protein
MITGKSYLDPGDRMSGVKEPPELVTVACGWGPDSGPRNVAIKRPDGSTDVVPFPRRLRKLRGGQP